LVTFYKEVTSDSTTAKGKKKKKSATEAQKIQRAADADLWNRVYEHYRGRGKHCKLLLFVFSPLLNHYLSKLYNTYTLTTFL
jgi:hypothetical protein